MRDFEMKEEPRHIKTYIVLDKMTLYSRINPSVTIDTNPICLVTLSIKSTSH